MFVLVLVMSKMEAVIVASMMIMMHFLDMHHFALPLGHLALRVGVATAYRCPQSTTNPSTDDRPFAASNGRPYGRTGCPADASAYNRAAIYATGLEWSGGGGED